MQRSAASHLGIFCLPMSHKKDARLIWVINKIFDNFIFMKYYSKLKETKLSRRNSIYVYIVDLTGAAKIEGTLQRHFKF